MTAIGSLESVVLNRTPKFLQGPNLGRFLKAYALMLDGGVEALRLGMTFANPLLCPRECLPVIAKARGIPVYPTEPEESQRQTLASWLQMHRHRGSSRGRLMRVRNYFLGADGTGSIPTIYMIHRDGSGRTWWHWFDAAGAYHYQNDVGNFDYASGDDTLWSQTFCLIEMSESDYTEPNRYDDGHEYDDGEVYDAGGANPLPVAAWADLVAMLEWAGAGHGWLTAVILNWGTLVDITAAPVQDATGWWSLPNGKWATAYDPVTHLGTRPPLMQWIYEVIP